MLSLQECVNNSNETILQCDYIFFVIFIIIAILFYYMGVVIVLDPDWTRYAKTKRVREKCDYKQKTKKKEIVE